MSENPPGDRPRSRHALTATIVAVHPANIGMAMDAGAPRKPEAVVARVRLPVQIPHRRRVTGVTPEHPPA